MQLIFSGGNYAVLEVFCEGAPTSLQMFIVLKNGEVHIWKFIRPGYEWRFVSKFNLSVSKNIQITSLCFDKKSKLLFWCERRTPTQCCVCNGKISADSGKSVLVNKSDLLHNCPPVQLFLVGPSGILLHPTANSPTGLTMYWSPVASRIQVYWCSVGFVCSYSSFPSFVAVVMLHYAVLYFTYALCPYYAMWGAWDFVEE